MRFIPFFRQSSNELPDLPVASGNNVGIAAPDNNEDIKETIQQVKS